MSRVGDRGSADAKHPVQIASCSRRGTQGNYMQYIAPMWQQRPSPQLTVSHQGASLQANLFIISLLIKEAADSTLGPDCSCSSLSPCPSQ